MKSHDFLPSSPVTGDNKYQFCKLGQFFYRDAKVEYH